MFWICITLLLNGAITGSTMVGAIKNALRKKDTRYKQNRNFTILQHRTRNNMRVVPNQILVEVHFAWFECQSSNDI